MSSEKLCACPPQADVLHNALTRRPISKNALLTPLNGFPIDRSESAHSPPLPLPLGKVTVLLRNPTLAKFSLSPQTNSAMKHAK
uniref:Uncharacterized protein n=1 Tax=Steinernema glaseri TaxID=37863 RepID=A0A1I7ZHC4_9BILA